MIIEIFETYSICSCVTEELLSTDSNAVANFLQEAVIMKDFDHINVLSLIGVVLDDQKLPMVIIPYMSNGDLKRVLKDETEVSKDFLSSMRENNTVYWSPKGQ